MSREGYLQRFNLEGLGDAIREVAGQGGEYLPIAFELPDGKIAHWVVISVRMLPSTIDPEHTPLHRALVVRLMPD